VGRPRGRATRGVSRWPLILSDLSVPLLGIVDTAVVGHLPEPHHPGAEAIGALTFNVLCFVAGFLPMGTTGLTARALGRGDGAEVRAGLARSMALAVGFALVLLFAGGWLVEVAARAQRLRRPEMASYLRIRVLAAPAALANMVVLGRLLGLQAVRGPC
jgi:MATE family multidrug resistance protein